MKNFIFGFLVACLILGGVFWIASPRIHPGTTTVSEKKPVKWHCPMHTWYISDKPGKCPICGMDLVPIDAASAQAAQAENPHAGMPMPAGESMPQSMPEGYAPVKIETEKLQLMGVTTGEVKQIDFQQSIRTVGRVVPDETRTHHVHTKFEGYIEQIYADFVGQFVKKGQPLFSIYSPELVATQQEYLLALKAKEQMGTSTDSAFNVDLLSSARERLALWDISPAEIAKLESTRQPIKAIVISSPVSGYITAKTAVQGTKITPMDNLYDIVDLSHIWVMADVYEVNLPFVKVGMPATVTLPYEQDKTWIGKVTYINPVLEADSRTLKARIEIENPKYDLKPDMYTHVIFGGTAGKGLAVPESAVLSTGERNIVFVEKAPGEFEPREVKLGVKTQDYYEVKSGLSAGEKVVTSGNFLLDSESKLRASVENPPAGHQH